MHDHDPRVPHLGIRGSPPRACDFIPNTQSDPKQQLRDYQQRNYQMQHQPYQQHYIHQHHHPNQLPQQQLKNVIHDDHSIFVNSKFSTTSSSLAMNNDIYNVNEFEDIDEDQVSDLDEDEEEELRLSYENYRQNIHKQPDVTSQLLDFANMVSADIKKFFGRTKGQDDSCDVYEDKWATSKSGRELYYADLLRIAQGETEPASKSSKKSLSSVSSSSSSSLSPHLDFDNRSQFSGRRDISVGMGPLSELFEYGHPSFTHGGREHKSSTSVSKSRGKNHTMFRPQKLAGRSIPMHERKFPDSFWREPCTTRGGGVSCNYSNRLEISQHHMMTSSKLPDFSDLVESWHGGIEGMTANELEQSGPNDNHVDHREL